MIIQFDEQCLYWCREMNEGQISAVMCWIRKHASREGNASEGSLAFYAACGVADLIIWTARDLARIDKGIHGAECELQRGKAMRTAWQWEGFKSESQARETFHSRCQWLYSISSWHASGFSSIDTTGKISSTSWPLSNLSRSYGRNSFHPFWGKYSYSWHLLSRFTLYLNLKKI